MLLLRTDKLPEGDGWLYEVKFDGYRALAIKSGGQVRLRSRNDKDFTKRYPGVVAALRELPDETVIDGEVVALDATGKPVFSLLQNGGTNVHFYVFDLLMLQGKDLTHEPLSTRRHLLEHKVLPQLREPVRCSPVLDANLSDLIQSIRAQGLERLVAKRANSRYESGQRSGAWMKMRAWSTDCRPQFGWLGISRIRNRSLETFPAGTVRAQDMNLRSTLRAAWRWEPLCHNLRGGRGLHQASCPLILFSGCRVGRAGRRPPMAKTARPCLFVCATESPVSRGFWGAAMRPRIWPSGQSV